MMFKDKKTILTAAIIALTGATNLAVARPNIDNNPQLKRGGQLKTTAATCKPAEAKIDLDINNVRARLMTGGDMWWDNGTAEARYEVPKGSRKNSLFAGSVWIGGIDAQGQLKVAAQTYRQDGNDYWPGPLDDQANVSETDCAEWDRFWKINRSDLLKFRTMGSGERVAALADVTYETILQWPAKGNAKAVGNTNNTLGLGSATREYAPFIDADKDGKYDPELGDYPDIFGDQFVWWVFNDKGNTKQQSQTEGIGIEVQASAFGFATKDFLNDATFYNYRLINRSNITLDSTYIATWTDADLGYYRDDYIGCDTTRGLGILYNGASVDGAGQINSYGSKIPMVGIDFFKGPIKFYDSAGLKLKKELGMESFTYYNNDATIIGNPNNGVQIYYYMTGSIRNGQRFTNDFTGPGSNSKAYGTGPTTRFVFYGDPEIKTEWSECTCLNPVGDRRFVHSAGPFKLDPGVVNDITIGAVWVSDAGGCPTTSFKKIKAADDLAQELFDNGFRTIEGPEAPRMVAREMDRKLIFYLLNDFGSNNFRERYGRHPDSQYRVASPKARYAKAADSLYKFEGYRVFQLKNGLIQPSQIFLANGQVDNTVASEVFQCDVKNGVTRIINYEKNTDISDTTFTPIVKVLGKDSGIRHSFEVSIDQFASGDDKRLVNYRNYYFVAIAYAYNNFAPFDAKRDDSTQDISYIESSKGPGGTALAVVAGMPNPANGDMGTVLNADYGDGVIIKRLEGIGNGHNDLRLTKESVDDILANTSTMYPTYQPNHGPVKVQVVDPVKVKPGNFEIYIQGPTQAEPTKGLSPYSGWYLLNTDNGDIVMSEGKYGISEADEQIIEKYGIAITIQQTERPGDNQAVGNGLITSDISFADPAKPWLSGVQDEEARSLNNWIRSGHSSDTFTRCKYNDRTGLGFDTATQVYESLLSENTLTKGTWAPYVLAADEDRGQCGFGVIRPNTAGALLYALPSVDVILTSDKSKWSRCVVMEMQDDPALSLGGVIKFRPRTSAGWNMDIDANGRPVYSKLPDDAGMSWFPGYAINQETGERLNIMFGEDSWLKQSNGTDMIWNPTTENILSGNVVNGGKHYIYVVNTKYDSCKEARAALLGNAIQFNGMLSKIAWVGLPLLSQGFQYRSLNDGLIPTDVTIRFRVDRPYAKYLAAGQSATGLKNDGNPLYSFSTNNLAPTPFDKNDNAAKDELLDKIHAVPNPYYAYSGYELNRLDTRVRIINLPKRATISIYTVDGTLIRKLDKDNPNVSYIDWDIRNAKGLPIASGMYLMHINVDGVGEKVVKWFGAMRPVDIINY